jgi:hypothetical protein
MSNHRLVFVAVKNVRTGIPRIKMRTQAWIRAKAGQSAARETVLKDHFHN